MNMFFLLLIPLTKSWWGHAHMIIARIAELQLSFEQKTKIEKIISYYPFYDLTIPTVSTWQDDLKDMSHFFGMGNWHFIDNPIIDPSFQGPNPKPTYNLSGYLNSAWKSLNDPTTNDPWVWGFHVRSLIHFLGDIHTPHHNCGLFSSQFPKGDMGGNLYTLNCQWGSSCNNIHFLWDSVGRIFPLMNPLQNNLRKEFENNVTKLINEYPMNYYSDLKYFNPKLWSDESFDVANSIGYGTPKDETPSEEYLEKMRKAALKRVAVAGYRLATVLKNLTNLSNIPVQINNNLSKKEIFIWIFNTILFLIGFIVTILTHYPNKSYENLL